MTEREALERARQALVTYQGLCAFDGASPEETFLLNDSALLAELDRVLGPPTGEILSPLEKR